MGATSDDGVAAITAANGTVEAEGCVALGLTPERLFSSTVNHIFEAGLLVHGALGRIEDPLAQERLRGAVAVLDAAVVELRSAVINLVDGRSAAIGAPPAPAPVAAVTAADLVRAADRSRDRDRPGSVDDDRTA